MISATATIIFRDSRLAESIERAIMPDNEVTSQGLCIETRTEGSQFVAYLLCEKSLDTMISTLDDLFSCIAAVEETLNRTR